MCQIGKCTKAELVYAEPRTSRIRESEVSFSDLPAELRNRIYNLVLVKDRPIRPFAHKLSAYKERDAVALMLTCRQILKECQPIYYGMNTFEFDITDADDEEYETECQKDRYLGRWMSRIGPATLTLCKHVKLYGGMPSWRHGMHCCHSLKQRSTSERDSVEIDFNNMSATRFSRTQACTCVEDTWQTVSELFPVLCTYQSSTKDGCRRTSPMSHFLEAKKSCFTRVLEGSLWGMYIEHH